MPYCHARGAKNTRVKNEEGSLADLRERFREPEELEITAKEYHRLDKDARGEVKKQLPYFVGGTIKGRRKDDNVTARTLLTLDIEAKEGQETQPPIPHKILNALVDLDAEGWVYTSLSHTLAAPRYRVVLPLGEPLVGDDLQYLEATTRAAAAKLGLREWCTGESWVLSQAMYLPAKLKGGIFWEQYRPGRQWRTVRGEEGQPADIPDEQPDPVLTALRRAGLYRREDPKHPGKHYIVCPWDDEHGKPTAEDDTDTQTVFYEAHYDGNPRAAVKCFDTEPDEDGHPHLSYSRLVQWLRENGHLQAETADTREVLEDYDAFDARASVARFLQEQPAEREWAWERFAPIGKVTVLAGPGGVSKSMLMLHLLAYGALGMPFAGIEPAGKVRGLYVSYEDDTLELHRRVHRLATALREADDGLGDLLYDVQGDIARNLRLFAADEEAVSWLVMNKPDQRGQPQRTRRVEWLVGYMRAKRLKVLVLDPAVYTHALEESDPGEMAAFLQTLTYIAKTAECAVVVLHHMHKTAQWAALADINQGSLRGASSFADNSRSVSVLVNMPAKDAPTYGLTPEQAKTMAVLKHVKHNYSASLGERVFERKGPLLVFREDITQLDEYEARAVKQKQDTEKNERKRSIRAQEILQMLAEQDNGRATAGMLDDQVFKKRRDSLGALPWLEEQGYVAIEGGEPGKPKWHVITDAGRKWLE